MFVLITAIQSIIVYPVLRPSQSIKLISALELEYRTCDLFEWPCRRDGNKLPHQSGSPKDGVREQIACDDLYSSGNTKTESHIRGKGTLCNALTTIVSPVLLMLVPWTNEEVP